MSYGSMPAGRAIEGTNSGLLREPNSNARGGRKRSRRAVLFSVVWSRLVMNRPLIGERAAKCGPPLLRSPPGVWRASQLRQFLGAQLTKSCRAGGSNALFLGWSQFPEFEEEQEVVGPLQRAAYDEGPAEARKGQATSPPAPSTIARFILQGARKRMRTHPPLPGERQGGRGWDSRPRVRDFRRRLRQKRAFLPDQGFAPAFHPTRRGGGVRREPQRRDGGARLISR